MIKMRNDISNTFNLFDKLTIRYYDYLYTGSIAKEVASTNEGNSGGILIIGMLVIIVGLIGFILTKNKH